MVREVRNKMRLCELRRQGLLGRFRPLAIEEFEEIKTDPHAINPDQAGDMLDVIDISVDRCLLFAWTHQHRVDSNNAAPLTDHPDLFVTEIALDIVITPGIAVGDDERPGRLRENIFEARWINVGKVNNNAKCFAGLN